MSSACFRPRRGYTAAPLRNHRVIAISLLEWRSQGTRHSGLNCATVLELTRRTGQIPARKFKLACWISKRPHNSFETETEIFSLSPVTIGIYVPQCCSHLPAAEDIPRHS